MKKIKAFSLISLGLIGCTKSQNENGVITRDCTGTYLTINEDDFHVCNTAILESYTEGTSVTIDYNTISGCLNQDTLIVCELYHQNEGWIEVTEVE